MQLKEDTLYKLRNGEIVGPLVFEEGVWFEKSNNLVAGRFIGIWLDNGVSDFFCYQPHAPEFDIIEEVKQ